MHSISTNRQNFLIKFIIFICIPIVLFADLNFNLIKKGMDSNNTVLIIGGIQGDEPGGFLAASLIATKYNIKSGSVWVVPNLNFPSIIARSRGLNGDMNRKFAYINKLDRDYKTVADIKGLIVDNNVSLIINLHDGSGYYRKKYINAQENPLKWGNSCIIDQEYLKYSKYGQLLKNATQVRDHINANALNKKHVYHIKNTKTKTDDPQMRKSLTYFAIRHNKSAYANEASKSLPTSQRVYYHLLAIEKYLQIANIKFERNFNLTPQEINKQIMSDLNILINNKFYLTLDNIRPVINYVLMPPSAKLSYSSTNPLIAIIKENNTYKVHYGNRLLTTIKSELIAYDDSLEKIDLIADTKEKQIKLGSKVKIKNSFLVKHITGYRVNIIGYSGKNRDESGIHISKNMLIKRYSVDKSQSIYRVEFYKHNKFCGMFLVEFE